MSSTELELQQPHQLEDERSVAELTAHVEKIGQAMSQAMREDEHYGVIPGTQKPTLLKPGAEMLCLLFRLGPEPESTQEWEGKHLTVTTRTVLRHIPTGNFVGAASGMCSTREKRYAERKEERTCPSCGAAAIIKGKEEYGGGWVCFKKKGGCGAKYQDGDEAIESQTVGVIENPDLADLYNTVLKMAEKRALIAAVLNATAASQVFTQDIEDAPRRQAEPVSVPQAVDDRMASDAEQRLLIELFIRKGGKTAQQAKEWLDSYGPKGASANWVARQVMNLSQRPDVPTPTEDDPAAAAAEVKPTTPELPVDEPELVESEVVDDEEAPF